MPNTNRPYVINKGKITIDEHSVEVVMLDNQTRVICALAPVEGLVGNKELVLDRSMSNILSQLPLYIEVFTTQLPYLVKYKVGEADKPHLIKYNDGNQQAYGYDSLLLADAAETYLQYRDDLKLKNQEIPEQYASAVRFSELLMVKLAYIGMMALIDEATQYQEVRDDGELVNLLRTDT